MNRNEITLQEMFSSVIGELREGGRWGRHTSTSQRWMHSRHSPNGNRCPCANWARPYWRGSKTSSGRGIAVGTLCPPTSRRYARCIIGRWTESTYGMYPRLFEHVYTGTRADRKKALEASDISSLVRETERSLQGGTLPNAQQKQGFSSYSCSCSGAYLSWIWHTCTKGTCREIYYRTDDGRRDGRWPCHSHPKPCRWWE